MSFLLKNKKNSNTCFVCCFGSKVLGFWVNSNRVVRIGPWKRHYENLLSGFRIIENLGSFLSKKVLYYNPKEEMFRVEKINYY